MEKGTIENVKNIVRKVEIVYVATASLEGTPHIAAAEGMSFTQKDQILFRAWFCLKTLENLEKNPKLSLAILDPKTGQGYQIMGRVERIESGAVMNGYAPEQQKKWSGYPQAEHKLLIQIEKAAALSSGPHSDEFI